MRISFFDTSSRKNGWCAGEGCAIPIAGCFELNDHDVDYGGFLTELERFLVIHVNRFQPEFVGYESPILVRHDKLPALRKLYSVGPFIEYFFQREGIPCEEVGAKTIKKELTGNHLAEKADMVFVALKAGIILPKTKAEGREDAADAFGGWKHFQRLKDRKSTAFWDQRIYGRRGHLI